MNWNVSLSLNLSRYMNITDHCVYDFTDESEKNKNMKLCGSMSKSVGIHVYEVWQLNNETFFPKNLI